jgi:DNA mismatch endonuclease (patch repair protein)
MRMPRSRVTEQMRRIRSKHTVPERLVRRVAEELGLKYRLHSKDLPGSPDLVFPDKRKVVFVHGCFWHLHTNCALARMPKRNLKYWRPKLTRNKARDRKNKSDLTRHGWRYVVIWECQAKDLSSTSRRLANFLERS